MKVSRLLYGRAGCSGGSSYVAKIFDVGFTFPACYMQQAKTMKRSFQLCLVEAWASTHLIIRLIEKTRQRNPGLLDR